MVPITNSVSLPPNDSGSEGEFIYISGSGPFYHDGTSWNAYGSGSAGTVLGSGTANAITKWLSSNTLTDSSITDNGSLITLGASVTGSSAEFSSGVTASLVGTASFVVSASHAEAADSADLATSAVTALTASLALGLAPAAFNDPRSITTVTALFYSIVEDTDFTVLVDTSGGARNVKLPAIDDTSSGRMYNIIKATGDANNAHVIANSATDDIVGSATKSLTDQYQSLTVQASGTTWWVI